MTHYDVHILTRFEITYCGVVYKLTWFVMAYWDVVQLFSLNHEKEKKSQRPAAVFFCNRDKKQPLLFIAAPQIFQETENGSFEHLARFKQENKIGRAIRCGQRHSRTVHG